MSTFEIVCEHCRSRYLLPVAYREALKGSLLTCVVCTREWTPLRGDVRGSLAGGAPAGGAPPIALHRYLQSNPYGELGRPATPENLVARSTTQAVRVATGARLNLRVSASGPGLELDTVFDIGDKSFFIGGHDCHLELFHAPALPERAIRVRAVEGGFEFEGMGGFLIPLGPVSVAAGRIAAGSRLDLVLDPYRIVLEPTSMPGGPIRLLEERATPAAPPAAPAAQVAPPSPPPAAPAAEPVADLNQTTRGLAAIGFDTRRFADPLADLDVGLLGLDPPVQGETLWLRKSPTLVGRTTGDILIADSRVSGKHAQIDILGLDQYSIKDLASTNGTTVNDRPASTTRLKDGDIVAFGGVRLQFVVRRKQRKTL
jgi:hypothetical protein